MGVGDAPRPASRRYTSVQFHLYASPCPPYAAKWKVSTAISPTCWTYGCRSSKRSMRTLLTRPSPLRRPSSSRATRSSSGPRPPSPAATHRTSPRAPPGRAATRRQGKLLLGWASLQRRPPARPPGTAARVGSDASRSCYPDRSQAVERPPSRPRLRRAPTRASSEPAPAAAGCPAASSGRGCPSRPPNPHGDGAMRSSQAEADSSAAGARRMPAWFTPSNTRTSAEGRTRSSRA